MVKKGNEIFAERISELRAKYKLTLAQLGEISGISKSGVSHWEKSGVVPSDDALISVSNYFGVTIDYLLGNDFTKQNSNPKVQLLNRGFNNLTSEEQDKAIKILEVHFDQIFTSGMVEENDDEF